jgi:uncharacterized paraquat-inducible protein A
MVVGGTELGRAEPLVERVHPSLNKQWAVPQYTVESSITSTNNESAEILRLCSECDFYQNNLSASHCKGCSFMRNWRKTSPLS